MVTRRGHSPRERSSRGRGGGFADVRGRRETEATPRRDSRARWAPTPRRSRTSRASGDRLVAVEASAAADGCRRHATSGASARACPRRELPTEGPSFGTVRRRRARGSSARAPTRVGRRAPRGSVTTTRGTTFCFSSADWDSAPGRKIKPVKPTHGGRRRGRDAFAKAVHIMSLAFRTKKKASLLCERKTSTSRPPRLRTRGAATPGSPCARRRSCRRTTWAWCRSSRRRGWCSRPWGSSSAAL